ncbi:hypothetical protein BD410DRAFT_771028, partial [Rickenella mellea]
MMGIATADRPEPNDVKLFVAAKRTQRGGILYLMASTTAAQWLRQALVKESFLQKFSSFASIRNRGHTVILEYVPTTYDLGSTFMNDYIERDNGMDAGEILDARYLKDPTRRTPGQCTAFILMTIRSAQRANTIIRDGIIIEGKTVFGRKNIPEAKRCMKCQSFEASHIAASCKQIHDTCGMCGEMHRTSTC